MVSTASARSRSAVVVLLVPPLGGLLDRVVLVADGCGVRLLRRRELCRQFVFAALVLADQAVHGVLQDVQFLIAQFLVRELVLQGVFHHFGAVAVALFGIVLDCIVVLVATIARVAFFRVVVLLLLIIVKNAGAAQKYCSCCCRCRWCSCAAAMVREKGRCLCWEHQQQQQQHERNHDGGATRAHHSSSSSQHPSLLACFVASSFVPILSLTFSLRSGYRSREHEEQRERARACNTLSYQDKHIYVSISTMYDTVVRVGVGRYCLYARIKYNGCPIVSSCLLSWASL